MLIWRAVYSDRESLSQYNDDGSENRYKDINRSKLSRFELYNDSVLKFTLFIHDGQRLIFRRRNFIKYSSKGEERWIVYLVGYQFNDEIGKNYKVINYVHENGLIELDDDRKDLVILPEE